MNDVVYFKPFTAAFVTPRIPNQKLIVLLHKHASQIMLCLHRHFLRWFVEISVPPLPANRHALYLGDIVSLPYVVWYYASELFITINTYLLTSWSRVLLEKLIGSAASQEIPGIFGTRRFLTVPTSARHLSLFRANSIQSPQLPPTS